MKLVSDAFSAAPPATVLLPWRRDPHPDHLATWERVVGAAPGAKFLGYSVWLTQRGESADWPDEGEARGWTFDPAPWRERKAQAIAAHATQLGLITDDPRGFTLPPEMVGRALDGPELYFEVMT